MRIKAVFERALREMKESAKCLRVWLTIPALWRSVQPKPQPKAKDANSQPDVVGVEYEEPLGI